jgi:hypothetical protein
MCDKIEIQNVRDVYPTRQVIHKLCASDNVEIQVVDIFVMVRHGVTLHSGITNISFVLLSAQKT